MDRAASIVMNPWVMGAIRTSFVVGFTAPLVLHEKVNKQFEANARKISKNAVDWALAAQSDHEVLKNANDGAIYGLKFESAKTLWFKLAKWMLTIPTFVFLALVVLGYHKEPWQIGVTLFGLLFTGIHWTRMKAATSSVEKFPFFGRAMHAYYPLFDERSDLTRSVKMETPHGSKGKCMQDLLLTDLRMALINLLLLFSWASLAYSTDVTKILRLMGVGLILQVILSFDFGPVPILDAVQRSAAFHYAQIPLRSIKTTSIVKKRKDWETQGALYQAHYNEFNSSFKPWAKFLHSKIYAPLRKSGYSVGWSMATTTMAKGAINFIPLVLIERENKNLFFALMMMTLGYALYAFVQIAIEDQIFVKYDTVARKSSDVKEFGFFLYKILSFGITYWFFTLPMVHMFFTRYGLEGYSNPFEPSRNYGLKF